MAYQSPGVYVEEVVVGAAPIGGVGTSTAGFIGRIPDTIWVPTTDTLTFRMRIEQADETVRFLDQEELAQIFEPHPWPMPEGCRLEEPCNPVLITNFTEFTERFGGLPGATRIDSRLVDENNVLAHAVRGFFLNGGTRCWVTRVPTLAAPELVAKALNALALIDEIAIVAIPALLGTPRENPRWEATQPDAGVNVRAWIDEFYGNGMIARGTRGYYKKIDEKIARPPLDELGLTAIKMQLVAHCESRDLQDRFAIIDGVPDDPKSVVRIRGGVPETTYGAIYFPWIDVTGKGDYLPPSGHIAGLYARVDATRGVHKAPANEVLKGAMGLQHRISRALQAGLNPEGINAIREFDGTIKVWGARTLKKYDEFTYISVRRLFLYLRESIDEGTQWAVFEPNGPQLWARIVRNITAFLTNVWSEGALFGEKPEEAFYVKCDAETNPARIRDLGQVVTEIGVAVQKPAEFVIFRIGQTQSK